MTRIDTVREFTNRESAIGSARQANQITGGYGSTVVARDGAAWLTMPRSQAEADGLDYEWVISSW